MSETKTIDLEFNELAKLQRSRKEVKLILRNGFQMIGTIEDYDCNVVIIRVKGLRKMVYRHNISTVELE